MYIYIYIKKQKHELTKYYDEKKKDSDTFLARHLFSFKVCSLCSNIDHHVYYVSFFIDHFFNHLTTCYRDQYGITCTSTFHFMDYEFCAHVNVSLNRAMGVKQLYRGFCCNWAWWALIPSF